MSSYKLSFPALQAGRIVITRVANDELRKQDVFAALKRHLSCDWGEVSASDWRLNDEAFKSGERILSSYSSQDGTRFWIITEADRSATTILLPSDY